MNKSAKYYEEAGDNLANQGRTAEARRAYLHAMGDYTQPMDLGAYTRVLRKLVEIDSADLDITDPLAALGRSLLARSGGRARSERKASAARVNGQQGGRPKKAATPRYSVSWTTAEGSGPRTPILIGNSKTAAIMAARQYARGQCLAGSHCTWTVYTGFDERAWHGDYSSLEIVSTGRVDN